MSEQNLREKQPNFYEHFKNYQPQSVGWKLHLCEFSHISGIFRIKMPSITPKQFHHDPCHGHHFHQYLDTHHQFFFFCHFKWALILNFLFAYAGRYVFIGILIVTALISCWFSISNNFF